MHKSCAVVFPGPKLANEIGGQKEDGEKPHGG